MTGTENRESVHAVFGETATFCPSICGESTGTERRVASCSIESSQIDCRRLPKNRSNHLRSCSGSIYRGITNPVKNFLIPTVRLRALMKRSRSPLIAESFVNPGSWQSMEIVYANTHPVDWLDRQALRDNPISMAARNRRKIICDRLTRLIERQNSDQHVTLLGIGAGPGRHLQSAMIESGIEPSRVTAYLIDLADEAFPFGRRLAASYGLQDSVQFIKGDARRIRESLPGIQVNIAKLVGIIEYLNDDQFIELLAAVRDVLVPDGSLVTHGLVDKYGTGAFLARVFNLRHHQRNHIRLTELLTNSGFRVTDCEYEPTGIHPIATAVRAM